MLIRSIRDEDNAYTGKKAMDFDKPVVLPSDVSVIMSSFPFGEVLECHKLGGVPNTTYKAVTEQKVVAVRIYSHGQSSLEHITLELEVLQHLAKMNFESPRLLTGTNGEILQQWKGYWVCATEFINGAMADTIHLTQNIAGDVGRVVASFQKAMESFQIDAIPEGETFMERGVDVLKPLYSVLSKRGWDIDVRNVIPLWERASEPFIRHSSDLNSNVIHADIWPANVICEGEKVVGLIDFDDCLYGATIIDVAIALMEFSMFQKTVMDEELAMAFLTNFFRHGGMISSFEENLIVNAMEVTCAIWVGYYVMQEQTFEEGEIFLRRLNLLSESTYRQKIQDDVRRFIRIARTSS